MEITKELILSWSAADRTKYLNDVGKARALELGFVSNGRFFVTVDRMAEIKAKRNANYTDEWRARKSKQGKALMTDEAKEHLSNKMKRFYEDNPDERTRRSEIQRELYDSGFGDVISQRTKEALSCPTVRRKMSDAGKARFENMTDSEREAFSNKCREVWTDDLREQARNRTTEYQASVTPEIRERTKQRKLKYWTPERRIAMSDFSRSRVETHKQISESMRKFWANIESDEKALRIQRWMGGAKCNVSRGEQELFEWVSALLPDLKVVRGDRILLGGEEIDIYLPDYSLALEYNGSYYHSTQHFIRKRNCSMNEATLIHQNKSLRCKERGIHLIHIWDWEWDDARIRERIKSQIRGRLGLSKRIFARNCELREMGVDESKPFFDLNSEFKNKPSIFTYGLYYDNECVMAYGVSWKQTGRGSVDTTEVEIGRSATKLGTVVVGGASRLMKAVRNHLKEFYPNISKIAYFVDFDKHMGSSLEAMGARFVGVGVPTIRIAFTKNSTLVSKHGKEKEVKYGRVYYRMPHFHASIKEQDELGNLLTLANAGTLKYELDV